MSKSILANDLIRKFEQWAPKKLAYNWDNVGLQVGTLNKQISKIMITLDVLENVVDEAIDKSIDLIIAHHPLLFNSIKKIDIDSPSGRIINKLIKHDITVYAAHTNLDIVDGGVSDMLADQLDIKITNVLLPSDTDQLQKLIVYVPESHADFLIEAMGAAGAGYIGNYSHCSFKTTGTGAFKPMQGTNPYIGTEGQTQEVQEVKIETIIKKSQIPVLIPLVEKVHPYEEVAYDLIPLENKGSEIGAGRVGDLQESMTLNAFCEFIKERFDVPVLRVTGDLEAHVKKVAILGGSGKGFISEAKQLGADVYVTGDMTFHEAQDAMGLGLNVVDPGHHVEKVMKQVVKAFLDKQIVEMDADVEVITSTSNTEPFQFL
ncbi:Nif3-like dinuclear metal center hexameric protein [Aquibacillus rhizosphaerae]|uniref:GTP cyclohydrolase 1 type 2 homolog n=1 Tax=Aquibacillus rhizosphaerae TaxID=3051431 RepID=A0ABT7L826_9BACI|nr:Nif3-like dinuclear metal center hexameric protein [Aquibacillus sp. LR5S19]MDL4841519.1 Nif3-like dinuclear metal center hexameric protein [Aquibacillus sp. LR5S19]